MAHAAHASLPAQTNPSRFSAQGTSTMAFPRQTFPGRLAQLDFSLEVPPGLIATDLPDDSVDFNDPAISAPLVALVSPIAAVVVTVAARPAYADGSVMDWIRFLCEHHGITITGLMPVTVGGPNFRHPAIFVEGHQTQDGTALRIEAVALEDGQRFVTINVLCPEELWPSYGTFAHDTMYSFELVEPRGPTAPLVQGGPVPGVESVEDEARRQMLRDEQDRYLEELAAKRVPAIAQATALIENHHYDEADRCVVAADGSIHGAVALAGLYRGLLEQLVVGNLVEQQQDYAENLFRRALRWAQSAYPEPHTQMEADEYARSRAADREKLVAILGYEPDA